jgi:PIN domain nuclease of toxin-antitoxin system
MIWYVDAPHELSSPATAAMDAAANTVGEYIFISAITLVEMRYLVEKNRIKAMVLTRVEQELDEPDPMIVTTSVDRTIAGRACLDPTPHRAGHARPHNRGHCSRAWVATSHTRY